MADAPIRTVRGYSVWDSRGRPTVEVEIELKNGATGRAIAPAGASTGSGEAVDLRDGGTRFGGYGVDKAVASVNTDIAERLIGMNAADQAGIDKALIELDGTANKRRLGGNALIATSMAVAHAGAAAAGMSLWVWLGDGEDPMLPVPEIQIFGGGAHASGQMDLQDFMAVPHGASSFREATDWVAEVYRAAGDYMDSIGKRAGVADEGGYWPLFESNEQAIEALVRSIENAGFKAGHDIGVSLDIAATQMFRDGGYFLKREGRALSPDEWFEQLASWMEAYPILMIEDPFVEGDFENHARFTARFGGSAQIIGDDLLVTNTANIATAAEKKACNTLLCKPNQAGTLSEAKAAHEAARALGWGTVVSARSGETEDVTIAHLALGWGITQFKVGSFSRSERMAKWNEMLRLEHALGAHARYAGRQPFERLS